MKIAKINYGAEIKIPRKSLQNIAKNLKGDARLEITVKKFRVEITPLDKKISARINSKFVVPCIKYATSEYAIIDCIEGIDKEIKVYYNPLNRV